ncbi:MAG: hypothetical protein IGQ45_11670 [Cyanobacterium sp. T60_A2020_053]|nr:hypothetical protein [Cyanobacterium sp. T60_A2020_053]
MAPYPLINMVLSALHHTLNKLQLYTDNYGKLSLLQQNKSLIYKSPIAFILAKKYHLPAPVIATNIQKNFPNDKFNCHISGESWLEFSITTITLSDYLNELANFKVNYPVNNYPEITLNFPQVYIFSRCCALLYAGHYQQIITLDNSLFKVNKWKIEFPKTIDYITVIDKKSYEMNLIKKIINNHEILFTHNKINYLTMINEVGRALEDIEKYCRLQGKFGINNPTLITARLGLIALGLRHYQNLCHQVSSQFLPPEL